MILVDRSRCEAVQVDLVLADGILVDFDFSESHSSTAVEIAFSVFLHINILSITLSSSNYSPQRLRIRTKCFDLGGVFES